MTILAIGALVVTPFIIWAKSGIDPLDQIGVAIEIFQDLRLALWMATVTAWLDRRYYWRRAKTVHQRLS